MRGQDHSAPPSPTIPRRQKRSFSAVSDLCTSAAVGSDETLECSNVCRSGLSLEVTLAFQEGGDACAVDAPTAEEEIHVYEARKSAQEIAQDYKKETSKVIYVKRHALVHSIYARVSDKVVDWTLEKKFAEARYSHFRTAFAQASVVMPLGTICLAANASLFQHWERVGILLVVVAPIYLVCAYIAFRQEQHFLRLSGTSSEKLLICALCVQTLAIVLAECARPELDYGMLAMQMGYLNNFTPMTAFSMQMVSAVFGLLPYCLAKIITFITPSWTLHDMVSLGDFVGGVKLWDDTHKVGDLAICTPADPRSAAQLVTSMLVPFTIFLYQVLVTFLRDVSMRVDSLCKHNLNMKRQILDIEQRKNEDMLSSMLPKRIITTLKEAGPNCLDIEPSYFSDVTVIFVEVCDFARLCSIVPARDVVEVLNIVYHEFDRLSDLLHVYKVETVAEVYMAVVGAPYPVSNHADVAAHFGLALMHSMELMRPRLDSIIRASKLLRAQSSQVPPPPMSDPVPLPPISEASVPGTCNTKAGEPAISTVQPRLTTSSDEELTLLIRIGLNSGQLFAGVVGMDSPRYKLVGDTVNTASRMESTSAKGKIQVSQTTKAKLTENMFILLDNGDIPVKGKGKMNTYYLTGYAGSETYETRKIIIERVMQIGHHNSCNSTANSDQICPERLHNMNTNWSLWTTQEDTPSSRERDPSLPKSKDGDGEHIRDTSLGQKHIFRDTLATSRQDVEKDKVPGDAQTLVGQILRTIGAEDGGGADLGENVRFTCWQRVIYFFLLVPASQKNAKRITELNADRHYFDLKLEDHLSFARNLTILMPLALSVLCVVDLVESGVTSLDKALSYRDAILVRDLGNSFVAIIYVFVLSMFKLSRRMAQACTIIMLLLQFAALLTAGIFLWETERGIVAIIAMYGAYVLFYTVCTLLQRLAVCATAILTYVVMKATWCNRSVEALQNIGFLVIFIASMTCSLWLQEHLSHVFYFEQRASTKYLDQIKDAKSVGAQLLTDLLPSHVVNLVRDGISPIAETYDGVTILFTDIKGFTKFSTSISPQRLCHVLNSMYSNFDEIITTWELHKVEIIGDAYWVSAGCPAKPCLQKSADHESAPPTTRDKQKERAEFAMRAVEVGLALLRALPSVCDDTSLQMRVGIHTGSVVAGVVGKKGPRYHLFGSTVGYAVKMESTGIPGRVQVSDVTHTLLEGGGHAYDYEARTVEIEEEEPPVPTWLVNKSNAREAIQIQKKLMEERRRLST